jgi:hypothetical protein
MAYLLNRLVVGGLGALAVSSALVACGTGASDGGGVPPAPAPENRVALGVRDLRQAFPNARVDQKANQLARVFGSKLAAGRTPLEAAERFRLDHGDALGSAPDDLEPEELQEGRPVPAASPRGIGLMYDPATGQHKFTLFRYGQKRAGVRVFDAGLRTVVRNGSDNAVVWASSSVRDLRSFQPKAPSVAPPADPVKTMLAIRGATDFTGNLLPAPTAIRNLTKPELVVFAGTEKKQAAARLAIQYTADTDAESFEVIADAETGDILNLERLVVFENVVGTVRGNVTEGFKATECAEEVPTDFPFAEVTGPNGASAFANATGAFTLTNAGTTAVTLQSAVGGQFFDVTNFMATGELLSQSVVPPGPAAFLHNPTNADIALRAQSNGYANSNQARAFLLSYLPSYPTISGQLNFPVVVNRTDGFCPGNAWYDFSSINFCVASSAFGNTSFASINHHEYGHHIVTSGGSGQDEYGEGMADTLAALLSGEPGLGYGFFLNQCSQPLRTADNDCQYSPTACSSCGSEVHDCGNLLSGAIWSVRERLAQSEPTEYVDLLNALVLSSIPMHTGGSITPSIAVDLLTLDDDDANLDNGTPHYDEICGGFQAHGLTCPPILNGLSVSPSGGLAAKGPDGGPFTPETISYTLQNLGPEPALAYTVAPATATPWLTIGNATGSIPVGQTAQVTVSIDQAQAAPLARGKYVASIAFTNNTTGVGTTTRSASLQVGIPNAIFTESFEGGLGNFTVDSGTNNLWHVTSACAAALPGHSPPNALYFGLDSSCTFLLTSAIVAGTVTTGPITIADTSVVELGFNYLLGTEGNAGVDKASAQVSVNGGAYTVIASNNQGGAELIDGDGAWHAADFDIAPLLAGLSSATLRVRFGFDSADSVLNNYAGFLVDDVQVRAFAALCTQNSQCDDGAFCNGTEQCVNGSCSAGTPVDCADSIACTVDSCVEASDSCAHQASDAVCNDSNACNGTESCNATYGCQPGTPPNCDDGDACTDDVCVSSFGCQNQLIVCNDNNSCTTDSCNASTGCVFSDNGSCNSGPFQESGGQVVMEAEHFMTNVPRASHSWNLTTNGSASGGQVMTSSPNNGAVINTGYVTGSPELTFQVNFTTTGTYHVWARGIGPNADADSLHAGIDGTGPGSADRISTFGTSLGWSKATMDGPVATLNVASPGVHTISIWMREDGFVFDKLLLTTNAGFIPSGAGPAESPHGGTAGPCQGICSNPTNFTTGNPGNLGTAATCHQTTANLQGGNCGNFVSPRTLSVNGTQMSCNFQNWASLPPKVNGGYCITTTAGNHPWAYFTTW